MAINPLQFFNVGEQIGRVNSPAAGPGQMIRGILEQARKKGLIEAQSGAQLGQAKDLAVFKKGLEPTTKNVRVIDRSGNVGKPVEVGATDVIKNQPSPGLFDIFNATPNDPNTPTEEPQFDPLEIMNRILELIERGRQNGPQTG